jgi:toxin ParE1/3/4
MQIKWTKRATQNLESILAHIATENREAARKLAVNFAEQIEQLKAFPQLGKAGRVAKIRELVLHENYMACYRVNARTVEIVRVLHTKRKYP